MSRDRTRSRPAPSFSSQARRGADGTAPSSGKGWRFNVAGEEWPGGGAGGEAG